MQKWPRLAYTERPPTFEESKSNETVACSSASWPGGHGIAASLHLLMMWVLTKAEEWIWNIICSYSGKCFRAHWIARTLQCKWTLTHPKHAHNLSVHEIKNNKRKDTNNTSWNRTRENQTWLLKLSRDPDEDERDEKQTNTFSCSPDNDSLVSFQMRWLPRLWGRWMTKRCLTLRCTQEPSHRKWATINTQRNVEHIPPAALI